MVKISRDAREVLGEEFLGGVSVADRYAPLCDVVAAGWTSDGGATLLSAFRESYFGDRARFSDVGSYESAVNGRGIPDLDIHDVGDERIRTLMRRGIAFAWDALHAANGLSWAPMLVARISAAPIVMDPEVHTGYVTFSASEFQGAALSGIQVSLSSADCVNPLLGA